MDSSQMSVNMSLCEFPVEQFEKLTIDFEMKALKDLTSGGQSSKTSSEVSEISRSLANVTLSRKEAVPSTSRQNEAAIPSSSRSLDPRNVSVDEERDSAGSKLPRRDNKRKRSMDEAETADVDMEIENPPPGPSFALTPYRALAKLSGCDFRIELRCGMKQDGEARNPHLWQCVITCADLVVKAESSRKEVAKEVASNELLSQLPLIHPDCQIPEYALIPELFIDPLVIERDLKGILKVEEVDSSLCFKQINAGGAKRSRRTFFIYHFTFSVGAEKFAADHSIVSCAKAVAMKKMYVKFMGKEPTSVPYFTGEDCNGSQLYDFLEREIYRNVNPYSSLDDGSSSSGSHVI